MTDYAQERSSEQEVLESIFPNELTIFSEDKLSVRVEPEVQSSKGRYVLDLIITYSPTYPDELPEISIECVEGELSEEEDEELIMGLIGAANDLLGMAMVYTLSLYLRESLAALLEARYAQIQHKADEKARILEEASAIKTAGTKVTLESFSKWAAGFEAERKQKAKQDVNDQLKALPLKGREAMRAYIAKLSGRQLFEKGDAKLATSDGAFDEEGAVSVDVSQYERPEGFIEEEEEERDLGEMSD